MYNERMISYYPPAIQRILEFKAIVDSESPELDALSNEKERVIGDAYLLTMGENRIKQWERILNIKPIEGSSIDDRRDTIIARIRGQGKLNTKLINTIVHTFTGGTANSWFKDGVIYVEITPPPDNKSYKFNNVEQELKKKVPAHLELRVSRNYYEWNEVKNAQGTWDDIKNNFDNWNEVFIFVPFE